MTMSPSSVDNHRESGQGSEPDKAGDRARPLRDRAVLRLMAATCLSRMELVNLNLAQLNPNDPGPLRRAKRASLDYAVGEGHTAISVALDRSTAWAIADYLA